MTKKIESVRLEKEAILEIVNGILKNMTSDWDLDYSGGITPDTSLIADLTFESIDVVYFVVAIEQQFERRDLPFEKLLMINGRYVDDLRVAQVVDFLFEHLNA
jgi:acyl carrier protein